MTSHTVDQWAPFVRLTSTINGARGKVRSEMKNSTNSMSVSMIFFSIN